VDTQFQLTDDFTLRVLAYARENATGKTNAAFGTTVPRVHAIFDTIKLDDKSLARFSEFEPFIRNPRRGADDKTIDHLFDSSRDRIAETAAALAGFMHGLKQC
jgi:hypothetical protein